ncbi:defensin-like protein 6 [Capsella rubella]|uniref:defensin-like protein 6 n=1 Tax=Capsella rubella TaxID=81985 RepID=UPI000CD508E3|nr:defensin-like protein 6 [Capsella rubella]
MENKFLATFFLLLVLFSSQEIGIEGRMCQSKSHHFRRMCWSDHNCAMICRSERFSGGHCHGFHRRCYCTRLC